MRACETKQGRGQKVPEWFGADGGDKATERRLPETRWATVIEKVWGAPVRVAARLLNSTRKCNKASFHDSLPCRADLGRGRVHAFSTYPETGAY